MSKELPFRIVLLDKSHLTLLNNFNCGNEEINRYIKEDAFNDMFSGKGVTYLVLNEEQSKLIAYYTLASASLIYARTKDKSEKHILSGFPAIEIKMFAVSKAYQNYEHFNEELGAKILSDIILGAVIGDIYNYSFEVLGVQMIVLHSTTDAVDFYKRNNFCELGEFIPLYSEYTEDCIPMYMRLFDDEQVLESMATGT